MRVSSGGVIGVLSVIVLTAGAVYRRSAYNSERWGYFVLLWLLFRDVRGAVGVNLVGAVQARQTGA